MIILKDNVKIEEGLTQPEFIELASKLKNSVYPKALTEKPSSINEQCILITNPNKIEIWKEKKISIYGKFKEVILSLSGV